MSYEKFTPEEIESRGQRIYENQIRSLVEADNLGRFVVIDVESGEYEMADSDLQATKQALANRPRGVLYGVRVGYSAAYTLGRL
jgi:hypothetical protein